MQDKDFESVESFRKSMEALGRASQTETHKASRIRQFAHNVAEYFGLVEAKYVPEPGQAQTETEAMPQSLPEGVTDLSSYRDNKAV